MTSSPIVSVAPVEAEPLGFRPQTVHIALLVIVGAFAFVGWLTPPLALAGGIGIALTLGNPMGGSSKWAAKTILQGCIILLGFGMNLHSVLHTGGNGLIFAAATILGTLGLGWLVGRLLGVAPRTSLLISVGTAICGGSAIAAVGSIIGGEEVEMSVALGTVFVLNAVALYLFPIVGHALHMSQLQFGTWAGVAIHDVSSVVGASAHYGMTALQIATAVKLARSLWIVPVSLMVGATMQRDGEQSCRSGILKRMPWFIFGFVAASVARAVLPGIAEVSGSLTHLATAGLTVALFLIGGGMTQETLRSVGWRPMAQGVALWVFISSVSLLVIVRAWT